MKKFLAILMCGILLMSMVACTSNNDNSNPVTPNGNETTVSPETPTDPTDTTTSTNPPETTNPTDDNDGVEGDNTQNNETENGDSDNNDLPPENNDNTNDNGNDNEGGNDANNKDNENGTVDNKDNENTNDSTDNNDDANNNDNNNDGNDNDDNTDDTKDTEDTEDDKVVDPNAPHTPTAIEQQILDLINAEREKAGLAPLTYNADIYECAVIRANEALEVWSHTRPDGTKYWTVYEECGKKITNCCGENLAKTFKDPVQIVQMLMESEGHRKNILYEDFKSVCIVVLVDERGYYYMSQCFMG